MLYNVCKRTVLTEVSSIYNGKWKYLGMVVWVVESMQSLIRLDLTFVVR